MNMDYLQYILIIIIALIIAIAVMRSRCKDFKLELNKLVEYLGGRNNIVRYEYNKSRFIVDVVDVLLVLVRKIKIPVQTVDDMQGGLRCTLQQFFFCVITVFVNH